MDAKPLRPCIGRPVTIYVHWPIRCTIPAMLHNSRRRTIELALRVKVAGTNNFDEPAAGHRAKEY